MLILLGENEKETLANANLTGRDELLPIQRELTHRFAQNGLLRIILSWMLSNSVQSLMRCL
jgi:hypothetical protein